MKPSDAILLAERLGLDPGRVSGQEVPVRCPRGCADGRARADYACNMSLKPGKCGWINCFRCPFSGHVERLGSEMHLMSEQPHAEVDALPGATSRIDVEAAAAALLKLKPAYESEFTRFATLRGWPDELGAYMAAHRDILFAPKVPLDHGDAERLRKHARKKHRPYLFLIRDGIGRIATASRRGAPTTDHQGPMMVWNGFAPTTPIQTFGNMSEAIAAARTGARVVFVEGAPDFLVADWWASRHEAKAIGALSASGLRKVAAALANHLDGCRGRFVLCPHIGDKDEMGQREMLRAAQVLQPYGDVHVVLVPTNETGKGDLAQVLETAGANELDEIMGSAIPLDDWPLKSAEPPAPAERTTPLLRPATDTANAERLAELAGGDFIFVNGIGFLGWDGTRFLRDERGAVRELAKRVAEVVHREADTAIDPQIEERLRKWARSSSMLGKQNALLTLAETLPEIRRDIAGLDRDPMLLNAANGTLDLRTGELRAHSRTDLLTCRSPVAYDRNAVCPRWTRFLCEVMGGDQTLVDYLRRAVGYSLTGNCAEQVFFLLHGFGANGKSTFLEVLRELLGDYARAADFRTFLRSSGDGPRNDLAALATARFVTSVEPPLGKGFAEATLKQLTGGDAIAARFLFKEQFEFVPKFKLWLAANHVPEVQGTDHGFWRRVRLVPFEQSFRGREDRSLRDKLRAELPGILAWAVQGALEWAEVGLGEPQSVLEATKTYREDMDVLGGFLAECCVTNPHLSGTAASEIYARFSGWLRKNGYPHWSQRQLGLRLRERGFQKRKSNVIVYDGLGLKAEIP